MGAPSCQSGLGSLIKSMASWSGGAIWGASGGPDPPCGSSDPPRFPAQETRRAEDRAEMDDLGGEVQALQKVLGHVHQVRGENSQPKIAPFAFAQRLMSPSLLHGVHGHPAGWRRGGWRRELLLFSLFPLHPLLTSSCPLAAEKRHPHSRAERSLQTPAASAGLSGFSPHCRCSEMKLLRPPQHVSNINTYVKLQACVMQSPLHRFSFNPVL